MNKYREQNKEKSAIKKSGMVACRAFLLLMVFTIITGFIYPLFITFVGQWWFPKATQGSLIFKNNILIGSTLLGQHFQDPKYFWSRPSSTTPQPYNALNSRGSNLGPSNPILIEQMRARIKILKEKDPENSLPIPIDLVTSSASGLDPHISPQAANYQVARIVKARQLPLEKVQKLVIDATERRQFGFLGAERVNVLKLNLSLEAL